MTYASSWTAPLSASRWFPLKAVEQTDWTSWTRPCRHSLLAVSESVIVAGLVEGLNQAVPSGFTDATAWQRGHFQLPASLNSTWTPHWLHAATTGKPARAPEAA